MLAISPSPAPVPALSYDTFSAASQTGDKLRPSVLAQLLLSRHDVVRDQHGYCYEYRDHYWQSLSTHALDAYAYEVDVDERTTAARRKETVAAALVRRQITGTTRWDQLRDTEVPLADAVVDVVTGAQREHRRDDWLTRVVPHQAPPRGAECPRWMQCMDEWFGSDPGRVTKEIALQEFTGYVLLSHARYKRALILHGPPDCGKSAVVQVLRHLVGPESCTSISVAAMDDPRKLAPIKGKALNIMGELPADALIKDGAFKSLVSTGDPVLVDQKFEAAETIVPSAKHVFACNSLPRVDDRTAATYNRLLIVAWLRSMPAETWDRDIDEKLRAELPGILRWALYGARRLVAQKGQFTEPEDRATLLDEMSSEANPVKQFLAERCRQLAAASLTLTELRKAYREWSGDARMGPVWFGRLLAQAGHQVEIRRGARTLVGYWWRDGADGEAR